MRSPAVVLAVVAVLTTGVARAGTEAENRAAAEAAAPVLLDAVRLPDGAVRSDEQPPGTDPALSGSGGPLTPLLMARHTFWRVPASMDDVVAYIRAHSPNGNAPNLTGEGSDGHGTTWKTLGFDFGPQADVLRWRSVQLAVVPTGESESAVRADAWVVWWLPRPPGERVPAGVRRLRVTDLGLDGRAHASAVVTGRRAIRRVIGLVDGLERAQPDVVSCPTFKGRAYRLTFLAHRGGPVLAQAVIDGSGCPSVTFAIRNRSQPGLMFDERLFKLAAALFSRP